MIVRFSARPPARFAKGADFNLWVKRLELYFREAKIPDVKRGEELVALLDDDAFRVVSQSGFVSGDRVEYEEVKKCLQEQYAPKGVELEWQRKLHSAHQERPETLLEFSGRLRMLADKAYPSWSAERRLEMAREQFIHGVISSSVQMRLLRKQPESLEAALALASQWESVELAQQSLRGEKQGSGASLAVSGERDVAQGVLQANTVEELALRVQQLSQDISKLASREVGEKRSTPRRVPVCWNCKQKGHIRRNCPQRKERSGSPKEIGKDRSVKYTSAVACTLILQGRVEGRPTRMLVDTGSSVTLVHEKVWNDISQDRKLSTPQCPVMAVNGDSLRLCGQIDLALTVGKHVRTHTVLVVREMTQECLLGTDFLEQYGCVVDLGRRTMIMLGETIPLGTLYGSGMSTCHVFVQETAVVPPYHEMRLQVQLEGANTDGDYVGLFQPKAEMSTQHGLLFACSLSPVHDGKAVVQLVNPSAIPVTLHCKEKVGQVSPWDGREGANMVEPALGTRLPARSTEAIGKAVEELMGDTSGLSREECAKLKAILHHFSDVISVGDGDLGRTNVLRHTINSGDTPPVRQPARKLPFHQRDVVQKMIQGMLQQGIIEPSGGAWASPIVLVRKKDGSYRFCVDFRRLNSITKKDVPGKGCNKHLQLVVPRSSIGSVLQQLHSSPSGGHLGIFKTLEKVRSRFYWPGQRHDIEDWCRACELCAARKSPPRSNRAPMQQVLAGGPFQRVAMDILGPLPLTDRGNKYILVLGDYFTKWVESFPIPNMEAKTIANMFVGHFVSKFGAPDVLHTDQGRNFESALFKEVCLLLGVHKTRTTPYHPQSDGLVERFNRTLLDLLSIAAREDEQNWDLCIPTVMLAYRTSVQESTGCTPYFLLFGREARLPVDVMFGLPPSVTPQPVHQYSKDLRVRLNIAYERVRERLGWRQCRQKMIYDRRRTGRPYGVGEWVWLHCPAVPRGKSAKLHSYWQGPYKVVKVFSNVLYLIQHRNSTRKKVVVHFDRLKACARGGTFEQGTTATRDAAEESQPDVSDAEESEDDNLVIDHQEGNLEPEQQEVEPQDHQQEQPEQEVEPQDDQQEQPPVETLPPLQTACSQLDRCGACGKHVPDAMCVHPCMP